MKLALVLILVLSLTTAAEGTKYTKTVPAGEILDKISKGMPVEYDHVIVKGDLNISKLGLPSELVSRNDFEKYFYLSETTNIVSSPLRINDSMIDGKVDFKNTTLEK